MNRLEAHKKLLKPDLLIRDRLNHTAWNDIGVCFAKSQISATDGYDERQCGFTYNQSNHESPYRHLRMPQFDAKNP